MGPALRALFNQDVPPPQSGLGGWLQRGWSYFSPAEQPPGLEQKMQALLQALSSNPPLLNEVKEDFYRAFMERISHVPPQDRLPCLKAAMNYLGAQNPLQSCLVTTELERRYYSLLIVEKLEALLCGEITPSAVRSTFKSLREQLPPQFASPDQKNQVIARELFILAAQPQHLTKIEQMRVHLRQPRWILFPETTARRGPITREMEPLLQRLAILVDDGERDLGIYPPGLMHAAQRELNRAKADLDTFYQRNPQALPAQAGASQPGLLRGFVAKLTNSTPVRPSPELERLIQTYNNAQRAVADLQAEFNALCRNDINGHPIPLGRNKPLGLLGFGDLQVHREDTKTYVAPGTEITGGSIGRFLIRLAEIDAPDNRMLAEQCALLEMLHAGRPAFAIPPSYNGREPYSAAKDQKDYVCGFIHNVIDVSPS